MSPVHDPQQAAVAFFHQRSASAPVLVKKTQFRRSSCITLATTTTGATTASKISTKNWFESIELPATLRLNTTCSTATTTTTCTNPSFVECRAVSEKRNAFRPAAVDKYKFSKVLGKGANGKVKLARDQNGSKAAIKVSRIPESNPSRDIKGPTFEKMLNEAQCLEACRGHRNVVQFKELMSTDRKYYLVTEYVKGGDLWDFVTDSEELSEETVKLVFRQFMRGVRHMHSVGIGHRDIKPENILVSSDGVVKLCDFGFAVKFNEGDELLPGTMGTVRCLAPEMIKRRGWEKPVHDPLKADIWGCGAVLHYMLTGGFFPFETRKDRDTLINTVRVNVVHPLPETVSSQAKDLLNQIFVLDPLCRPTAEEILAHPFLN